MKRRDEFWPNNLTSCNNDIPCIFGQIVVYNSQLRMSVAIVCYIRGCVCKILCEMLLPFDTIQQFNFRILHKFIKCDSDTIFNRFTWFFQIFIFQYCIFLVKCVLTIGQFYCTTNSNHCFFLSLVRSFTTRSFRVLLFGFYIVSIYWK